MQYFGDSSRSGKSGICQTQYILLNDSTSVLRYVRNETKQFHTFVANRIAIIRDGSDPDQWQHVSGDLNPGDDLSRGLSAEALLSSDHWIKGLAFL